MSNRPFGKTLREARQAIGLTGAHVSREARISPIYLSRIERGELLPAEDAIRRICAVLGQDPAWWIRLSGKIPSETLAAVQRCSSAAQEIIARLPELTPAELERLKAWIDGR